MSASLHKAGDDGPMDKIVETTFELVPVVTTKAPKPDDPLSLAFHGDLRAPSPNPSLLSLEDATRRGRSPVYLGAPHGHRHASRSPAPLPKTWREKVQRFWTENLGLLLVLFSQFFGTLMNVTTRMLEIEGNNGKGYHPFQILFARMAITVVCSSLYMWRAKTEHFPFGRKDVRGLLIARGFTGFFGVFGMYCKFLQLF